MLFGPDTGYAVLLIVSSVAASLLTIWKIVIPITKHTKQCFSRFGRAIDVMVGTEEVMDPDRPGSLLRQKVPDIGARVTGIEDILNVTVVHHVERAEEAAARAQSSADSALAAAEAAARDSALALLGVANMQDQFVELQATIEERFQPIGDIEK